MDRRHLLQGIAALAGMAVLPTAPVAAETVVPLLQFRRLADGVYLHVSRIYFDPEEPLPNNGMVVTDGSEALIVDVPKSPEVTRALLNRLQGFHRITAVFTHAHDDRMGGLSAIRERGIRTLASRQTATLAASRFGPIDEIFDGPVHQMTVGRREIEIYYPGPAHSEDNTVLYVRDVDLLFAGCMVRPHAFDTIGGVKPRNMKHWPQSLDNLKARYPRVRIVVPGHGDAGDRSLLAHTENLVDARSGEIAATMGGT